MCRVCYPTHPAAVCVRLLRAFEHFRTACSLSESPRKRTPYIPRSRLGGTASRSAPYSVAPFMSAPPHRSLHCTLRRQGRIAALNVSAISTLTPAGAQETQ